MSFFDNKNLVTVKYLLIFTIGTIFLLFNIATPCSAQKNQVDVELRFVKANETVNAGDLYFNILKVWNNTSASIAGNLTFSGPENWKIISFPSDKTILNPGDTVFVPIRVSPLSNALGGIAYIINASFRNSKLQATASTYLTLPSTTKWDFSVNKNIAYFTENAPATAFQVKLSNKGNTNELIKLKYSVGKLLKFNDNTPNDAIEFVALRAFSDTIINRSVSNEKGISFTDRLKYENNWKESAINVVASTERIEKSAAIQFTKLNSVYTNQRAQNSSPLNVDYQLYNLMSTQAIRQNAKIYGSLLFSRNRELQYVGGIQNFALSEKIGSLDVNRQLIYNVLYTDNRNIIQLGYNVNGGSLHAINGRGVTGTFKIDKHNSIRYSVTENPFTRNFGQFLGYSTMVKSVSLRTELTNENKLDGTYHATSALLGVGFNLFKYHTFSFNILGSRADYLKSMPRDTSVYGFSYRVSYNLKYKKLNFRLSALNSEHNYILNSGLQQAYLDSRYSINNRVGLLLYGTHHKYSVTRYPYNFYNPTNFNSNDNLRLTLSLTSGNVIYQIGPNYVGSIRQFNNSVSGYKSEYINYQPGVWSSATIKLGGYRSITPNLTVSNIRFYYKTNDPALDNYSFNKNVYYSAGVSYFDEVWRINAYYTSGSTTDLYRSVLVDDKPVVTRCLQFRPTYENFFFDRKVKLSASVNYAYYMPSGRENTSFNLRYDQYFKKGWNLSVSGYMYSNTRVDDEQGRISTKDLNVFIGISKSFNIQQPRLKYYDYKSIFFNDLDGNRIKTENEPPVSDILVNIQKDRKGVPVPSNIPEIELITDENGMVAVENLPKDNYLMTFAPLTNLQSLYFLNGSEQGYFNDKTRTVYIPLAESYRINGKIILVRDPNSTEGKISMDGVRITATGPKGETYSVLTDNFGSFVLSVPNADKYNVHVNNVFDEQFSIDADDVLVQFAQNKAINLDFTFVEKARGIQFDGGEFFKFNSLASDSESVVANGSTGNDIPAGEASKSYAVQLIATKTYREPADIKSKYNVKSEVLVQQKDGLYKYYTGDYSTIEDAKKAIAKQKLQGTAVEVDRVQLKNSFGVNKPQSKTTSSVSRETVSPESKKTGVVKQTEKPAEETISSPETIKPGAVSTATATSTGTVVGKSETTKESVPAKGSASESKTASKPVQSSTSKNNTAVAKPVPTVTGATSATKQEPASGAIQSGQTSIVANNATSDKNDQTTKDISATKTNTNPKVTSKPALSNTRTVLAEPISENGKAPVEAKKQMASDKAKLAEKSKTATNQPVDAGKTVVDDSQYMYTIQLDVTWSFPDPKFYKDKYNLPFDVICVEKNGTRKYFAGKYISKNEATADIARYGMAGFIVPIEESR